MSGFNKEVHMDNTIFFERFGLNPGNFVNRHYERIKTDKGSIYEAEEEYQLRTCPHCQHQFMNIHSRRWIVRKLTSSLNMNEELRIRRIRYVCPKCHKTHTFSLDGLPRWKNVTAQTIRSIELEFYKVQSFKDIAERYGVSIQTVINIFDEATKIVPRRELPHYLCIDEKRFEGDTNGKYCVILSNFLNGEVIDVLPDRQMPYLDEYFSKLPIKEINNVKVIISDMYEGYSSIKNKYFPKALFAIDLFHVVKLLSAAVNKLRIRAYNQIFIDDTIERHFLKTNWKIFLCNQRKISKSIYHSNKFDVDVPYGEIILSCLKGSQAFWDGYNTLQELITYDKYHTYTETTNFINRFINKLRLSSDELLIKVAESYERWKGGIVNGLCKNQTKRRFSNSIAENNNSHIQRVIDIAYGYRNFKRFRARIMLLLTYKKGKAVPIW